jgi:hypothetical protein
VDEQVQQYMWVNLAKQAVYNSHGTHLSMLMSLLSRSHVIALLAEGFTTDSKSSVTASRLQQQQRQQQHGEKCQKQAVGCTAQHTATHDIHVVMTYKRMLCRCRRLPNSSSTLKLYGQVPQCKLNACLPAAEKFLYVLLAGNHQTVLETEATEATECTTSLTCS